MSDTELIWTLDSSALIEAKLAVPVNYQWLVFKRLEDLVAAGRIAMPRQVIRETSEIAHPDVPGAWASGVRQHLQHALDPAWQHVTQVMERCSDVVDPNKTEEDADPYVLALALELQAAGLTVRVYRGRD